MSRSTRNVTFTPLGEGRVEVRSGRDLVPTGIIIDNTCRVYITQIPLERIERDGANALRAEFEAFGPVESYKMFTEKSGRFIGSVLCTYRNPADATAAVQNMNGQQIESSVLKVSLSRDHGVVLLHRAGPKGRRGNGINEGEEEDRWQHDQYQALLNGDLNDDTVNSHGYRRGGRRRRGGRGGIRSVDDAFERYIASRDREVMEKYQKNISSDDNKVSTKEERDTAEVSGVASNQNADDGKVTSTPPPRSFEREGEDQ
ncbi:hypothetical protein MOQ_001028 [Trypanosoma cruzi marinkellei]|uniref:RRM domain-containing protein n=1 Tax=Trypanosoma cruzi marinkellei TaxID=85056 RepID=K2NUT8_TRYCR|nr:hypothetical protein MOQ_001028 [Trypanosoma cruzi marinkellei]